MKRGYIRTELIVLAMGAILAAVPATPVAESDDPEVIWSVCSKVIKFEQVGDSVWPRYKVVLGDSSQNDFFGHYKGKVAIGKTNRITYELVDGLFMKIRNVTPVKNCSD